MKYGPIIFDPTSEEAKALIGKKVVGGWSFVAIKTTPEACTTATLSHIYNSGNPFDGFTFIREIIEDKPTYRPYESCDEMIGDYRDRNGFPSTSNPKFPMPLIWVKTDTTTELVTAYEDGIACVCGEWMALDDMFNYYTYLDGSPVGKEE